jgi:hypothetical protein
VVYACQSDICKDLFSLIHGPSQKRGLVSVFFGYFDGSNTHDGAKVWSLCGFLGDEPNFKYLSEQWAAVLEDPTWPTKLKRFHAVECVHRLGEFKEWSFADRLAIWGELISVIVSVPVIALGSVVITEDFQRLEAEELELLRSEALGTPLDLSIQHVFQRSISLTKNTSEEESIGLVFDIENPETTKRCADFAALYRTKFGFDKLLAGIMHGSSYKLTPLQAADLLAYGTYHYTMLRFPEVRSPDFPILPGFERLISAIFTDGGGFDIDSMKALAAKIKTRRAEK